MSKRKPKPGDLVEVVWVDHAGSNSDNGPECPIFSTPGYYREERESNGHQCLFVDRSLRVAGSEDFTIGWDAYPLSAVLEVKIKGYGK